MTLDEHTLRLLEVAGTWVSGIGTLLAVVMALYLARAERAVRLKVSAGVRLVVTPGEERTPEVISIEVVNVGARPAVITNVLWRWGILRRQYAVQVTGSAMDSLKIHQRLEPGHRGSFYIELDQDDQENWARCFVKNMPNRFRALWLRRLQIGVATAVGITQWCVVESTLREKLVEVLGESFVTE